MPHHFFGFAILSVAAAAGLPLLGVPAHSQEMPWQGEASAASRSQPRQAERHFKLTWTYHPQMEPAQDRDVRVPLPTRTMPSQSARYEVTGARRHQIGS